MIPLIIFAAIQIGGWIIPSDIPFSYSLNDINTESVKIHLLQYVVGSFVLAMVMSSLIGLIVYFTLQSYSRKTEKNEE